LLSKDSRPGSFMSDAAGNIMFFVTDPYKDDQGLSAAGNEPGVGCPGYQLCRERQYFAVRVASSSNEAILSHSLVSHHMLTLHRLTLN